MRQGIAGLGVVLVLAGCSGEVSPEVVTHTVTAEAATVTKTVEVAGPTVTETVTVEPTQEDITWSRQAAVEGTRLAMETAWADTDEDERSGICAATGLDPEWAAESIGGNWSNRFPELPEDEFLDVIEDFLLTNCN